MSDGCGQFGGNVSDTPRTDVAAFDIRDESTETTLVTRHDHCSDGYYVSAEFARALEREIALLHKACDDNEDTIEEMTRERAALRERCERAIEMAVEYGGIDGAHHKTWVIDQMVRLLAGDRYEQIVKDAKAGEDGPDTYEWDEGIAP